MESLNKKSVLLEFIEAYRKYPELWDTNNKDYFIREKKCRAYKVLVEILRKIECNANKESVVKKINSLRSNFRRELRKVEDSKKSGCADEVYVPSLWYYKEFLFLTEHEITEKSVSVLDDLEGNNETIEREPIENIESNDTENIRFPDVNKNKRKRSIADEMFSFVTKRLEREDDEFMILAMNYAQKLKKMQPLQRLFADRLINEVLLEGQLQTLGRHSSLTNTLNVVTNNRSNRPTVSPSIGGASNTITIESRNIASPSTRFTNDESSRTPSPHFDIKPDIIELNRNIY